MLARQQVLTRSLAGSWHPCLAANQVLLAAKQALLAVSPIVGLLLAIAVSAVLHMVPLTR